MAAVEAQENFFGSESHKLHDMLKITRRNSMESLGPEEERGAREEFESMMISSDRRLRRTKLTGLGPEVEAGARRSLEAFFLAQQHLVGECADIEARYLAGVQMKHDEIFDTIDCPVRRASCLRKELGSADAGAASLVHGRKHPFSYSGPSAGVGGVGPLMRPTARLHGPNRERFHSAGLILSEPVRRARTTSSAAAVLAVLTEEALGKPKKVKAKKSRRPPQLETQTAAGARASTSVKVAIAAGVAGIVAAVGKFFLDDEEPETLPSVLDA